MNANDFVKMIQARLDLPADGIVGPRTLAAVDAKIPWRHTPVTDAQAAAPVGKFASPLQSQMTGVYGPAGSGACTAGICVLPFPFVIAWDTSKMVTRFSCHEKLEAAFTSLWAEAARHYGEPEFRRLRLDRFGGCFNYRPMRGSSSLSIHSWGAAYDVDPERNGFTTTGPTATLSRPEYVPFWNIVEAHGAHVLGRRSNKDWMHFQFARWA